MNEQNKVLQALKNRRQVEKFQEELDNSRISE